MTTTTRTPTNAPLGERRVAGASGWSIAPLASAIRAA